MSVKSDFIRAVVEEGISAARKYFGSSVEKTIKETKKGKEQLEKAQQRFKDKKKPATQTSVKFKKDYSVQEGMGLDAITGRDVKAASDVDKGKAGKVTRSPEPGFLQQQKTEGSRKAAKTKADLSAKVRDGTATAAEKEQLSMLRKADKKATQSAVAKGAASRVKKDKAPLPELKSVPAKAKPAKGAPINLKTGEINESVFNKLTKPQQEAAIRNAVARAEGPQKRRIKAQVEKLLAKEGKTKAGETGVGARTGKPRGMSGATERNIKDIDEGVSRGRGGLDFRKGGVPKKKKVPVIAISVGMMAAPKTGKGKAQMAKGGMAYGKQHMYSAGGEVKMNPGLKALAKERPDVVKKILGKK